MGETKKEEFENKVLDAAIKVVDAYLDMVRSFTSGNGKYTYEDIYKAGQSVSSMANRVVGPKTPKRDEFYKKMFRAGCLLRNAAALKMRNHIF